MTTTLTRFILCAILFSYPLIAKDIDVSFEVFHASNKYMDIAKQKARKLNNDGFKCYILKGKTELSVRCNHSKTSGSMQRSIKRLQKKGVDFVIVNESTGPSGPKYQLPNAFYLGYSALNKKKYAKAAKIFEYNYNQENTYEHAYAYSLALLKLGEYKKAMAILEPYRGKAKAKKLYSDIESANKYNKDKKFYVGYSALNNKNYTKAAKIFKNYYNTENTYEHAYAYSLALLKLKKYKKALAILKPYRERAKAKKLYADIESTAKYNKNKKFNLGYSALNKKNYTKAAKIFKNYYNKKNTYEHAYAYSLALLKLKEYKKAMAILEPYRGRAKAKKLYADIESTIKYNKDRKFYLGYGELNKKNYTKAAKIFEYYYNKENTYEHAYAYSLALLKLGENEKAMAIVKPYIGRTKAKKLYEDIASTYMYNALNKKEYDRAHEIVDKYQNKSKKLHTLINRQEVDDALMAKEYTKAETLAKKYHFEQKSFNIAYMKALAFINKKEYDNANNVLAPYIATKRKARNLYMDNIISIASFSYAKKNYKEALDKLEPYKNDSVKVHALYNDILYNRSLDNGWKFVDKEPKSALTAFREACRIKTEYNCYSGVMYSYYNLQKYDKSLYLANSLYRTKPSDELSTMAMRSSLRMKDYKEAKIWFERTKNKKGLTSPYLLETFLTIDDYTKAKEYDKAHNIVDYLKGIYPQNTEILKREMQLYVLEQKYDKAHNVAQEILLLDKNSVEAEYTLAFYEFQHQDYAGCTQRLEDVNMTEEYEKNLYYRCSAYEDVSNKDMNNAEIAIQKVVNDDAIKEAYYYDVGDMYKSIGDERAVTAYENARSYGSQSIDTEFLYMYTLKDFKKYKSLDKEIASAYRKYPNKHKDLDTFRQNYEKERLYGYYVNKEYTECSEYADMIEINQNDRDIYKMGGWCSYALGEYTHAKEKFAESNLRFGENNEDIYAYALAAYNNGQEKKAKEALGRIKVIDNEKEAYLIAELYMNIQENASAKAILLKLAKSDKREEMLRRLNKNYSQTIYDSSLSAGVYYQSQTGLEGKSKFEKNVIPLDYDYYNKKHQFHIYFDGDVMYLYNGYLKGKGNSMKAFGLGTTSQHQPLATDMGFMPKLGIDYKYIRAEIGSTPIGAKIVPELTWLFAGYIPYNNWSIALKIEQQEIEETMLSLVGERAVNRTQEVNWGRVLKRGVEGSINYSGVLDFTLSLTYNPDIFGLNVENNSEEKATFLAIYHPELEDIAYTDVGLILAVDSYEKNSNLFTYGHGGYFSPKQFFLGSLYTKFGDILNKDWYYQAKLGLGFEGFIVEDTYKFPLQDGIMNSTQLETGYRNFGIVYKIAGQVGYKINDNIDFISGISLEQINGYKTQQASFAFVYRFNKTKKPSLNSFSLNHRVEKILK